MLINKIKSDALEARKVRKTDTATLLTTLYSEASMIGKNAGNRESTDQEVLQAIEKFIKNANEVKEILLKNNKDVSNVENEIKVLSKYLPQKMSYNELESVVRDIIEALKDINSEVQMGKVMSVLKNSYGGTYDGKIASEIVKKEIVQIVNAILKVRITIGVRRNCYKNALIGLINIWKNSSSKL